jgi:geranylgeranyl diphosphate synthase type I
MNRPAASAERIDSRREPARTGTVVPFPAAIPSPQIGEHLALVDGLLTEILSDLTHLWTTQLDDGPVDVLEGWDMPQLLERLAGTGGKRLRPVMSYLGWLAASGRARETGHGAVVRVGAALELLHLFALIHDDVMDESQWRRGQPTVHAQVTRLHTEQRSRGNAARFGESIAILLGDLAHAEADHLVGDLPAPMRKIWRVLVVELVCGQRRDLTGSAAGRHDLGHALKVARMKSGAYTVARPLELGAAAAGAPEVVFASLARYGRELGQAFALRDDLLGVWGDPARTGKPAGDDLVSGKPTAIVALAYERLRGPARSKLSCLGSPGLSPLQVAALQRELEDVGVVDEVEEMITRHVSAALDALDERVLDDHGVTALTQMAHQVAWRDR